MDVAPSSSEELIGGRYEVERSLGAGGMGAVYAVRDRSDGQTLALKRLHAGSSSGLAQLFEREYQTLTSLRHPRIVHAYDYGRDEHGSYYTMELLEGADLRRMAPMPWRAACLCLRDAASILGVLHARRLIHRDLNPRNLWQTPDGRIKLIDFGALASFGPTRQVVGTPPFVPPEALEGQALDQRADLYALGALGYWLLSGVHAYPAKSFAELPQRWSHPLVPLRALSDILKRENLKDVPEALEQTILALLRHDPRDRPGTTEELIDRLNAIADLEPENSEVAVTGYFRSKEFVGRERELAQFSKLLRKSREGEVSSLFIEGVDGVGRTRLVQELVVQARLDGATPVLATAHPGARPYSVVVALAEQLVALWPEQARAAAGPSAALIGQLSPVLRNKLRVSACPQAPDDPRALRVELQTALQEWLLSLCRDRLTVLLVDDAHLADEESLAVLAVLAHQGRSAQLSLVTAFRQQDNLALHPTARRLRGQADLVQLAPLTARRTREILRSLFGPVPYLARVADRLHRISGGNPAHCLELAQYLVDQQHARYADGTWLLPAEIGTLALPKSRSEGTLLRLSRLGERERTLARLLSVPHHGVFGMELCQALSPFEPAQTREALYLLVSEGVLTQTVAGYAITLESLRQVLFDELEPADRTVTHDAIGRAILGAHPDDQVEALRAAVHLLHAGATEEALPLIRDASCHLSDHGLDGLGASAPMMEEAIGLLKAKGRDPYALALPLGALCYAGYFLDRRYATRYGEEALSALQDVLKLGLAARLSRVLGGKLGLFVALAVAGLGMFVRRHYGPSPRDAVRMLLSSLSSLSGVAAVCLDPEMGDRCTALARPLTALGRHHAATIVHDLSGCLALRSRDRMAEASRAQRKLAKLLESDTPIRDLPEHARMNCLAGVLFSLGVGETFRDGAEAMRIADRLEEFGPLYKLSAERIRAAYFAARGNLKQAAVHTRRVDLQAIKLGSAWQVDTWSPAEQLASAILTHNAVATKRAARELSRLAVEVPSLRVAAASAKGAYYVLRGKYEEALQLLDRELVPRANIGWGRSRAMLARALNGLGQHERALEVCVSALSHLEPADIEYVTMTLPLQLQLASSYSGLGRFEEANQALDQLSELYADYHGSNAAGPLAASSLLDVRVSVQIAQGDLDGAKRSLGQLSAYSQNAGIPSLLDRVERLRHRIDRLTDAPTGEAVHLSLLPEGPYLITCVQWMLGDGGSLLHDRALRGVQVAVERSGADFGFLILRESGRVVHLGSRAPEAELVALAAQRMSAAHASDETAQTHQTASLTDADALMVNGERYCLTPLWAEQDKKETVVGALALGFARHFPCLPSSSVLRAIAQHIQNDPMQTETASARRTGSHSRDVDTFENSNLAETQRR